MRHVPAVLTAALLAAAACADPSRVVEPGGGAALAARTAATVPDVARRIEMFDACEPNSFNAVLGEGGCVRAGGVEFAKFLELLARHGDIGAWHFAPGKVQVQVGQSLLAINRGGEVHTFTEVEHFGGGIVQALNDLTGNPVPAPECLQLQGADIIPPGGSTTDDVDEEGTELYQCCIHPWMRTTVTARR